MCGKLAVMRRRRAAAREFPNNRPMSFTQLRGSKKVRIAVIVVLLVLAAALFFLIQPGA